MADSNYVSKDFVGTGQTAAFTMNRTGNASERVGHVFLKGAGTATFQLERRPPGDTQWYPIYAGGIQLYVWNYAGVPFSEDFNEGEDGTDYRLNCTAFTSACTGRISA